MSRKAPTINIENLIGMMFDGIEWEMIIRVRDQNVHLYKSKTAVRYFQKADHDSDFRAPSSKLRSEIPHRGIDSCRRQSVSKSLGDDVPQFPIARIEYLTL
jgi:hypothetical protein